VIYKRLFTAILLALATVGLAISAPNSAADDSSEMVTVEFTARSTQVLRSDSGFVKRYSGDVVMTLNPEVWFTADEVTYNGQERSALMSGGVTVVDSGRTLRSETIDYLFEDHPATDGQPVAMLRRSVSIEDSTHEITAYAADYWPDQDSVIAFGVVRARMEGGSVDADTLLYSGRSGNMWASGNVKLVDDAEGITIRSQQYQWLQTDSLALVSGHPLLTKGEGESTVTVRAESMQYDQGNDVAVAWDSVRIRRGGLYAVCDSVIYRSAEEQLVLYGSPRARQRTWNDTTTTVSETTGARMELDLDGTDVTAIRIFGEPGNIARAVATEYDSTNTSGAERWITGREIVFHIDDDQVDRLEIRGQAQSRHVPAPEFKMTEGINEASGDTMVISFSGNQVESVELRGGVQGTFWPPSDSSDTEVMTVDSVQTSDSIGDTLAPGTSAAQVAPEAPKATAIQASPEASEATNNGD
jgi:lipopolysaccharide export system protein LptA